MLAQVHCSNHSALPFLHRATVEELLRIDDQQKKQVMIFLVNSFATQASEKPNFKSEADCVAHLESLCVTGGEPVPADIDDFGLLAQKYV